MRISSRTGKPQLEPADHAALERAESLLLMLFRTSQDQRCFDVSHLISVVRKDYPLPAKKTKQVGTGDRCADNSAANQSQDSPGADALPEGFAQALTKFNDDLRKCQGIARVNTLTQAALQSEPPLVVANAIRTAANRRIAEIEATKA